MVREQLLERRGRALAVMLIGGALLMLLMWAQGGDAARLAGPRSEALPELVVHPLWVGPDTLEGLVDDADAVVDGRVVAVRAGEPIPQPRVRGLPEGAIADIPTTRVDLEVDRAIMGNVPKQVTLFQTGGKTSVRGGATQIIAAGDPAFEVGRRYVVFLQERPGDGSYLYYGPMGRYAVTGGGRLKAVENSGPARSLDNVAVSRLDRRLREAGGGR